MEKDYRLVSIGKVIEVNQHIGIQLNKRLGKALKYLEAFSHILVIYGREGMKGSFLEERVKLVEVNEKEARLVVTFTSSDRRVLVIGDCIYDIKPYFPCEDCVRKTREDDLQEGMQEGSLIDRKQPEYEQVEERTLWAIGEIRQVGGKYYLQFKEDTVVDWDRVKAYSHLKVFWWFDRLDKPKYRLTLECDPPYEKAPRTGILASRSPVRPNPIACTTVPVIEVKSEQRQIQVGHMDCFDKTPLMELMPYKAQRDRIEGCKVPKWLAHWPQYVEEEDIKKTFEEDEKLEASILEQLAPYSVCSSKAKYQEKSLEKANSLVATSEIEGIHIKGANQNNLKNVEVIIPYERLTVITGVSGSGKSSLAFDTLYAESQRRMVGSIGSMESGELLEQSEVEAITGLLPAVAISQKHIRCQPRSTVGTLTGISQNLRKLFACVGVRHCPKCHSAIHTMSEEEIVACLLNLRSHHTFTIKPVTLEDENGREEKTMGQESFISGQIVERQLAQRVDRALKLGQGAIEVGIEGQKFILQTTQKCYHCQTILFELTPSTFSFNDPESMCPVCKGLGKIYLVDEAKVIEDENLSILDGASKFWGDLRKFKEKPNANWMKGEVLGLAQKFKVDLEKPWKVLPEDFKQQVLWGSNGEEVTFVYENERGRSGTITRPAEGVCRIIERLHAEGNQVESIEKQFMREKVCLSCHGERLNEEGRLVTVADKRYPEVQKMSLMAFEYWLSMLNMKLPEEKYDLVKPLLSHMKEQVERLIKVGIGYLHLDRGAQTLSGGELQRIRFTALFDQGMTHMLYLLDEPTMGLDRKNKMKLIELIRDLTKAHHTIVAVEHDRQMIRAADWLIDMGPEAGSRGGEVIACGALEDAYDKQSITTPYLDQVNVLPILSEEAVYKKQWLKISGAKCHNLKQVAIEIPLGAMTCVTGVSGSGKSSLVSGVLYSELSAYLKTGKLPKEQCQNIEGLDRIQQVIVVSQAPIGRNVRSNPATYTGMMDSIRRLFVKTKQAKERGYQLAHFSFNSKEGQCGYCKGEGRVKLEAVGMSHLWNICPICKGKRYKKEVLEITYEGKNMAQVLEMSVSEAGHFFRGQASLSQMLTVLEEVGLGYLKLGQSATSLSGGEAQRLKLAAQLGNDHYNEDMSKDYKRNLYLLDEPSTGLHFKDIEKLMAVLRKLTHIGHTVLMVEHHEDMVLNSDWMIELGPEGGENGGYVLRQESVEQARRKEGLALVISKKKQ